MEGYSSEKNESGMPGRDFEALLLEPFIESYNAVLAFLSDGDIPAAEAALARAEATLSTLAIDESTRRKVNEEVAQCKLDIESAKSGK